jgi:hypothetical protein
MAYLRTMQLQTGSLVQRALLPLTPIHKIPIPQYPRVLRLDLVGGILTMAVRAASRILTNLGWAEDLDNLAMIKEIHVRPQFGEHSVVVSQAEGSRRSSQSQCSQKKKGCSCSSIEITKSRVLVAQAPSLEDTVTLCGYSIAYTRDTLSASCRYSHQSESQVCVNMPDYHSLDMLNFLLSQRYPPGSRQYHVP